MNVYLLVEGRRTEKKVYPAWLGHLIPDLQRVSAFDEVSHNCYYIFSAEGYPSILHHHLANAVADVNSAGSYDYLVVCLDADECSPDQRAEEVREAMHQQGLMLQRARLEVVIQNRCIETWFLGNRRVVSRAPQSRKLAEYLRFYDVRTRDPEAMGLHADFIAHSPFHSAYLKEVLRERGISYSKTRPGHVCDRAYLQELIDRVSETPTELGTLRTFLHLCDRIRSSSA